MSKKIAVLADIHGNYHEFKILMDNILENGIEEFIILGDIIHGGTQPKEVYKLLQEQNILTWIRGNTDDWVVSDKGKIKARKYSSDEEIENIRKNITTDAVEFIRRLPISSVTIIDSVKILCCHGSPDFNDEKINDYLARKEKERLDVDLIICGHTHIPQIFEHLDLVIFNVGSAGIMNELNELKYGIIEVDRAEMKVTHCSLKVSNELAGTRQ